MFLGYLFAWVKPKASVFPQAQTLFVPLGFFATLRVRLVAQRA
jgi:hypothetical protein